jgi:hypothetical protein
MCQDHHFTEHSLEMMLAGDDALYTLLLNVVNKPNFLLLWVGMNFELGTLDLCVESGLYFFCHFAHDPICH